MTFGLSLSFDDTGWPPGGELRVVGLGLQGRNVSVEYVGDAGVASNIAGVSTVRLFKAFYRRRFFDGRVDAKLGILPVDDDFAVIDPALLFINSGFGTVQTIALNLPVPIFPLGTLGAVVELRPHEALDIALGAYDGGAGDPTVAVNASELGWSADGGGLFIAELGWRPIDRMRLAVGGAYHSGRFEVTGRAEDAHGVGVGYLAAALPLGRWGGSAWSAFAHASLAGPVRRVVADGYADVGLTVTGEAWSRPEDEAGVGVAWTRFAGPAVTAQRRGPVVPPPFQFTPGEAVVEGTYRAAILPWLAVQPDVQWHRRPRRAVGDALAVAMRISLTL